MLISETQPRETLGNEGRHLEPDAKRVKRSIAFRFSLSTLIAFTLAFAAVLGICLLMLSHRRELDKLTRKTAAEIGVYQEREGVLAGTLFDMSHEASLREIKLQLQKSFPESLGYTYLQSSTGLEANVQHRILRRKFTSFTVSRDSAFPEDIAKGVVEKIREILELKKRFSFLEEDRFIGARLDSALRPIKDEKNKPLPNWHYDSGIEFNITTRALIIETYQFIVWGDKDAISQERAALLNVWKKRCQHLRH